MLKQLRRTNGSAVEELFRSYVLGGTAWLIMIIISSMCADAVADTFIFESGEALDGSIIRATNHTVIVRRAVTGGIRQVGRTTIREVRVEIQGGELVVGELRGWSDGVYEIQSGQEVIRIRDGQILSAEAMDAGPAKSKAGEAAKKLGNTVPEPDAETAVVGSSIVADRPQGGNGLQIEGFATPALENEAALIFEFKLSRPAEKPVVILFSTLDGTAVAGEDYQQQQGAVTVEAGHTFGQLDVPLINDKLAEPDENLNLFLSVDPKIAELSDRYITTTIKDDD